MAAFQAYASQYDHEVSLIRNKVVHTIHVAEICKKIAVSLGMSGDDIDLAWFLGLLRDIGRFEQARRYATFVDADSVDHAEFGADLLFGEKFIKAFPTDALPQEELELLETAIRLHNKLTLPDGLDSRTHCFCDLIRDADKVDIFRVMVEHTRKQRSSSGSGPFLGTEVAGDAVMAYVYRHRCVSKEAVKNRFEGRIFLCCMAFEMVFPESRRIVREQGCLSRLLDEFDENGQPLWTESQTAQMRVLREETEKVLGEAPNEERSTGAG